MPGRPTNEPNNYYAFGKQTAKGTEATTFHFLKHLSGSGFDIAEQVESVREGGDGQEVGLRYKSAIDVDGQGIANARPELAARVFAWFFGGDSVTTTAGTASGTCQDHLAQLQASQPYLTVEQRSADECERSIDALLNEVTIEGEAGRPIKLTFSHVGGGSAYARNAAASSLTPSRETNTCFYYPGGSYQINGNGTYASKLTKFRAVLKRNLDTDIRTTGLTREDVVPLNFDSMVEGTIKYEDKTLYDLVHFGGGTQIPIDLATGSFRANTGYGSGSQTRALEFGINQGHFSQARVNRLDPDGATIYLDFTLEGVKGATDQAYAKTTTASGGAF